MAFSYTQIMKTLNLAKNKIGCVGMQHLSDALKINNVIINEISLLIFKKLQTLVTLELRYNKLGPHGATYLSDALKTNSVR